jgi:AraC-like DNA-binding protein
MIFGRELLEAPMPRRDDALHQLLAADIARNNRPKPYDADIVAFVRYQIARLLPTGLCDLNAVATACNLPAWSLKRKLRARGLNFNHLLTTVRRELAPIYLVQRRMPATEVAFSLGYSELSAFSRAFRQWTGSTPRDFMRDADSVASPAERGD